MRAIHKAILTCAVAATCGCASLSPSGNASGAGDWPTFGGSNTRTNANMAATKITAANVARLRKARGLSLRGLSEALRKAGRSLSADAINKIENGRLLDDPKHRGNPPQIRRVDADDLVALAAALGVSPSAPSQEYLREMPVLHGRRANGGARPQGPRH